MFLDFLTYLGKEIKFYMFDVRYMISGWGWLLLIPFRVSEGLGLFRTTSIRAGGCKGKGFRVTCRMVRIILHGCSYNL